MQAIRMAIIGMGPRGLTVLERVLEHAHRLPAATPVRIDVYDDGVAIEPEVAWRRALRVVRHGGGN